MRTLSLIFCLFLVVVGLYGIMVEANTAGIPLMIIGSLSFLIIAKKTDKIAGYNPKSFMNR